MNRTKDESKRFLARSASEAKGYRQLRRVLRPLLICLVIATTAVYLVSVLYSKYGSFTVSVEKNDAMKYSLSLSETPDFKAQIARLNAKAANNITNISVNDLPADLDSINGEHNGQNYLAYTFYLKNVGQNTVTMEYYMYIANVTNDLDKAIRIRVYRDGEPVTFARTKTDGTGPEPGTTAFLTKRGVTRQQVNKFAPGEKIRFTVVIWIEGDDPDCVDDLIGGALKSDMTFSVIESEPGSGAAGDEAAA